MPDEDPYATDGGSPRTRKQILYQLNDRLKLEPGVTTTRFEPSRISPDTVTSSIDPTTFLGDTYPATAATLAVWWSPRRTGRDHFTIQWYESVADIEDTDRVLRQARTSEEYTLSCGWHQDAFHDELGPAHFQEEYPDGTTERYGVEFEDATPRWILSRCLSELPERLADFRGRLEAIQPDD